MTLKNKIIILFMLLGSAFFLYQGFTLLFHGENKQKPELEQPDKQPF